MFVGGSLFSQTNPTSDFTKEYDKEYLNLSSGLSNNYVSKISKDTFGMMWFAAEGGLNRYDGEKFKIFRPRKRYTNLQNENIETVFIDSRGFIWVGTKSGGVSRYSQKKDTFINFNDVILPDKEAPFIRVTDIDEDKEGNIWVATWGQGLYKINTENFQLEDSFLKNQIILDVEVDHYGNVWSVAENYLYKYDPSERRLISLAVPIGEGMTLFYYKLNNELLIGSSDGIFSFDVSNYELSELTESKRLGLKSINALNVDEKGRIWAGSWNQGLFLSSSDRKQIQKFPLVDSYGINTNYETVLDIYIDSNNQIWVSTGYGGVVKLNSKKSVSHIANEFNNDVNLPDNNIQSVAKDSNGALWCGTWNGGIGYSTDGYHYREVFGGRLKISSFLQIGDTMLVGTAKGLVGYNINDPIKKPILSALVPEKIKNIYYDSKKRLWVGTQQKGLFLFDYLNDKSLEKGVVFNNNPQTEGRLDSDRISKVVEDSDGNVWVGSYNGLYQYNDTDSTFSRKDKVGEFSSVIILSILPVDSNFLWIGMPGGLIKAKYTDNDLVVKEVFNLDRGLKDDYITAITNDSHGNIWLSNTSGIATIRKENQSVINVTDGGAHNYAMNIDSYYNDGKIIYFGSSNGLFSFDPHHIDLLDEAPQLIFDKLKIDNKEINVGEKLNGRIILNQSMPFTKEIAVTYNESIIALNYAPSNFLDRDNLSYYYRIKGLQDSWIDNGQNSEVILIGLDAGSYQLEIKSTRDKINFSEVSGINIIVSPPPWLSNWAYGFYLFIIIILFALISQFFVYRAKLRTNLEMAKLGKEKEHELNEAKLRFFTNISHELRTPLTLILSPITEILNGFKLDSGLKEKLTYVEKNANKLLDLINQLLDFRKADQGELKLRVAKGDFIKFAREIFLSFKGYAETQGVIYDFETLCDSIDLTYDRDKMEIVLCNLLSNAFKFTSANGKINIAISEDADHCIITVKDTGKGISKEYQDKIFNRFFQIQDSESVKVTGSGIGLALSHRIVQLHHGNIEVKSSIGRGSKFIVKIPKGIEHFEKNDFMDDFKRSEEINHHKKGIVEIETITQDEKAQATLLIIDDNSDILSYQKSLFEGAGYKVDIAVNGLEGMNKAFNVIPDLIISDLMMPEMDGIELCEKLKSDIRTSHIPFILLTARTSTVHEVDGLETGADDYVRKPFDAKVIISRVASLLENRHKVRMYFVNKMRFESGVVIEPINKEEQFIEDLYERVGNSLHDKTFSVEVLANELCMSQSTLYRKIKSLTGLSIAGFIRSVRLKKSTDILLTEDIKLSAVAYAVGFNDYKYFKKSFIEQYGISPKEFREKGRKT